MYTTIEADIQDGKLTGPEVANLPKKAHVLITLMTVESKPAPGAPVFGCAEGRILLSEDFDKPLEDFADYMG